MPRALHIGPDDKWVDPAVHNLSQAGLDAGDVIILGQRKIRNVLTATTQGLPSRVLGSKSFAEKVARDSYDVVVLHSLPFPKSSANPILRLISRLPSRVPVVWIGWGYDYYNDLIFQDHSQFAGLLPRTREALEDARHQMKRRRLMRRGLMGLRQPTRAFDHLYRRLLTATPEAAYAPVDIELLNRISVFSPRHRSEFDLVKSNFPNFTATFKAFDILSDDLHVPLSAAFRQSSAKRTGVRQASVIVGNSASTAVNHLDAVHDLLTLGSRIKQVAIPSSYGDQEYKKLLKSRLIGQTQFEITFKDEFVPPMQYAEWLRNFSTFAHAGLRQHAGWNILLMLANHRRVILRKENPYYTDLRAAGFPVNTFSDLKANPEIVGSQFEVEETEQLQSAMSQILDRSSTVNSNREFVDYVLSSAR